MYIHSYSQSNMGMQVGPSVRGFDMDNATAENAATALYTGKIALHSRISRGPWAHGSVPARDAPQTDSTVWYPADPAPDAPKASYGPTTITGTAVRNAPPLRGAFPVVAFSHGLGAVRYQSPFLCERLASHGFVVVSPDHPKSTMFDLDEDALVEVFLERPDDLRYTVDGLREHQGAPPWRWTSTVVPARRASLSVRRHCLRHLV